MLFILAVVSFLLSVFGVGVARDYALKHRVLDVPNARSSHLKPTPRGGGVAIIIVFFVVAAALSVWSMPTAMEALDASVIGLTALVVVVVGWLDDRRSLSPSFRIAAHFAAAFVCVVYFGVPDVPLGPWMIDLAWLGWPLAAIAMVWCLNFFNFMDGIDGIAAVEAVTMAIGAWILLAVAAPGHVLAPYLWLLAAAVAGFLLWNWPPAKIFMGDAASGFLGFLLAQFALVTSGPGEMVGVNVWCWLILFGVFFTDSTVTLALRVVARERLSHAHRRHAYQRLSRSLQKAEGVVLSPEQARANAHRTVSLAIGAINLFWLTPLAVAAALWPVWSAALAGVALAPLVASVLFTARHTASS